MVVKLPDTGVTVPTVFGPWWSPKVASHTVLVPRGERLGPTIVRRVRLRKVSWLCEMRKEEKAKREEEDTKLKHCVYVWVFKFAQHKPKIPKVW